LVKGVFNLTSRIREASSGLLSSPHEKIRQDHAAMI